jgi:methyltransferase
VVMSLKVYLGILGALAAERLFELWLSNRNARRAFANGGLEAGRLHYAVMVAFHTTFLVVCAVASLHYPRGSTPVLATIAVSGEIAAQALRYWSIATLGESWNTRIIVVPGRPPVTSGPYRYIRHPNYAAVAIEMACVPLIWGLVVTAVIFSVGNVLLLAWRIPLEEQSLGEPYRRAFDSRRRFIPGAPSPERSRGSKPD